MRTCEANDWLFHCYLALLWQFYPSGIVKLSFSFKFFSELMASTHFYKCRIHKWLTWNQISPFCVCKGSKYADHFSSHCCGVQISTHIQNAWLPNLICFILNCLSGSVQLLYQQGALAISMNFTYILFLIYKYVVLYVQYMHAVFLWQLVELDDTYT